MKLAFVGPWPPQPTGIADYDYALLPALRPYFEELVVVTDADVPLELPPALVDAICPPSAFEHWGIGRIVPLYAMGNSIRYHETAYTLLRRFPGITMLHDGNLLPFVHARTLSRGLVADYVRELGFARGREGCQRAWHSLRTAEALVPEEDPLLERVARASLGLIVHSNDMRRRVLRAFPQARVAVIPHLDVTPLDATRESPMEARAALGFSPNDCVVGAFGFMAPNKRLGSILAAMPPLLADFPDLRLVCVGEAVAGYDVEQEIAARGLETRVRLTGWLPLERLQQYIQAVDIGINLRYPTWGEMSGTLIRLMAAGKPVLVTQAGSFSELPDESVIKIPYDAAVEVAELVQALSALLQEQALRERIGAAARRYIVEQCTPADIGRQVAAFVEFVIRDAHAGLQP